MPKGHSFIVQNFEILMREKMSELYVVMRVIQITKLITPQANLILLMNKEEKQGVLKHRGQKER